MKTWILGARILRELVFTSKGLAWLPMFSLLLSALVTLFLTNVDLSLMDQRTMMFMTTQAIVLLGTLAVVAVGADAVAGERERGTLEALLAAPVARHQLLGGYLAGALAPWAAMVLIGLPYLAVVSASTSGFLSAAAYLLLAGSVLALGVGAWTISLSAGAGSLRNGTLKVLMAYACLAIPAVLSSALREHWVGRVYNFVDPFSNVMNILNSAIIDEQGFSLQMLIAFTVVGLWYARRCIVTMAPA